MTDAGQLGQYAEVLRRAGRDRAGEAFPLVAAHLADGCSPCQTDLQHLLRLLDDPDE